MNPVVVYQKDQRLSLIAFDDGKANVFNPNSIAALNDAFNRAEEDDTHSVIVSGRTGCFSGGLDLKTLPTLGPDGLKKFLRSYAAAMMRIFLFPKPVIAACTGHALAGGCIFL